MLEKEIVGRDECMRLYFPKAYEQRKIKKMNSKDFWDYILNKSSKDYKRIIRQYFDIIKNYNKSSSETTTKSPIAIIAL